jgi:hypothetical protein
MPRPYFTMSDTNFLNTPSRHSDEYWCYQTESGGCSVSYFRPSPSILCQSSGVGSAVSQSMLSMSGKPSPPPTATRAPIGTAPFSPTSAPLRIARFGSSCWLLVGT